MEKIQLQETMSQKQGLRIPKKFTAAGQSPFDMFTYEKRSSIIRNPDGSIVFEMHDVEVPNFWSQVATDILAQKYFRKAGVPLRDEHGELRLDASGKVITGSETSIKQVAHRIAGCWRHWGEKYGYFASSEDAKTFYEEMVYMIISQTAAPNSPQWFTTGLNFAYGLTGPAQGHSYVDPITKKLEYSRDAYTRSQPHACADYFTQLYTEEGTCYIGDAVEKNKVGLKVFDGEKFVKILATKYNGEKEVFRIKTKNGNHIDLTEDHLVLSAKKWHGQYEWKEVKYLDITERVQQPLLLEVREKNVFSRDLAKARLAGWIIGDGSVGIYSKVMRLEIITINNDEHQSVLDDIHEVFGEDVSYWVTDFKTISEGLEGKRIHLSGKKLHMFIQEYELLESTSRKAKIPTKIIHGSPQEKRDFLKALFQADGCVRIRVDEVRNAGDICLTTCSEDLSFGVLQLLNSLGIYSRISWNSDKRENRLGTYQVSIAYGSARGEYQAQIGFISQQKQDKMLLLNQLVQRSKSVSLIREEEIISIESIGIRKVYDIQTESGKFLGNGIVVHNCFIQKLDDDLVRKGGIFDLLTREARIFKYGSGSGSNFSSLRGKGEALSGGGSSSGLMSFLKIFDVAAGSIKSGGTTRRAAKMVCLDLDHPDIEQFIMWKVKEEEKVAHLVAGSKMLKQKLSRLIELAKNKEQPLNNKEVRKVLKQAYDLGIPLNYLVRALDLAKQGYSMPLQEFDTHYESEAYLTVSGQNSNNSVRIPNSFFHALDNGLEWELKARSDGRVIRKIPSEKLWDEIGYCAWASADPGVQFDTIINEWHTCPKGGRINASNPCSEYKFLDDTACNLASINLLKFYDSESSFFDVEKYRHAVRLWAVALEISVLMAQFPSEEIAYRSYLYRTLGLGFANIGSLLMMQGIPYDSDKGRAIAGALAAILTGDVYAASAEVARALGPFAEYETNKEDMLRVIRNHRRATYDDQSYEGLSIAPKALDARICPPELLSAAQHSWDTALHWGEQWGYRNAQATVMAPTGTIGLVMDCDTTGVEPDYALVKFKKLAGGGFFKIVNQSVPGALKNLGYSSSQIKEIINYCLGYGTLFGAPRVNPDTLMSKGLDEQQISLIEKQLKSAMDIRFVFNATTVGEAFYNKVTGHGQTSFLEALGFSEEDIDGANEYVCGTMTLEGAPHLRKEHYPIFDCANTCGKKGKRYIAPYGHLKMLAALQPFVSGSISKTINMPKDWTVQQIKQAYRSSWEMMLKCVALYRDGCKLSQPLNTTLDDNPELKKIIEEEQDDDSSNMVSKRVMLGRNELHLHGELEDGLLAKVVVKLQGSTPVQVAMVNALTSSINFGLKKGIPPMEIAQEVLNGDGHTVISELKQFIYETMNGTTSLPQFIQGSSREDTHNDRDSAEEVTVKCGSCGASQMRQNGTCMLCEICGETSGCS